MSTEGLHQAQEKMRAAGLSQAAIDVFSHDYGELEAGATGLIREETITPLSTDRKANSGLSSSMARTQTRRTL